MPKQLLIVDDSPVMRSFIRRIVKLSGYESYECREAGSGLEALAELQQALPDLVLTDINMPGMDGEQLVQCMKADERLAGVPIVVVSTDATQHRVQSLIKLGVSGYITKPFVPEKLSRVLAEIGMQPEPKGGPL